MQLSVRQRRGKVYDNGFFDMTLLGRTLKKIEQAKGGGVVEVWGVLRKKVHEAESSAENRGCRSKQHAGPPPSSSPIRGTLVWREPGRSAVQESGSPDHVRENRRKRPDPPEVTYLKTLYVPLPPGLGI